MIDRRDFLRRGLVTAAGLLLPWVPERVYSFPSIRTIDDDFRLYPNGDIRYVGGYPASKNVYSLAELAEYLRRNGTLVRHDTEFILDLRPVANINEAVARHLGPGQVQQSNESYMSWVDIGAVNT